jgi:probable blue pigment (indigoidine) exporter
MIVAQTIPVESATHRNWFNTACAPIFWGTMPAVAAVAFTPGHPLMIATIRSLGAGLIFLFLSRQFPPRAWVSRVMALGVINIALTFGLFFVSASRLPGGVISILMAFSPFWAAMFGWPLLRQRPGAIQLFLIMLGISGVTLLVGASTVHLDSIGILAGIGASSCMGCGIILIKKWGRPASMMAFTSWQLIAGGVFLLALTLIAEELPHQITWTGVGALSYLALACTAIAYSLWFRGIETIGPQRTAMLLLLVPLVALGIDAAFFGKQLSALQSVGAFIVLFCLYIDVAIGIKKVSGAKQCEVPEDVLV